MINLKRKEWLLLSRYLDGDLSAEQVIRIEKRLRSDAALKQAYERMLHTRQVLRSVPQRNVPHSYVLSASMVEVEHQAQVPQRIWKFSSAAAAVVAVVAIFLQVFSPRASIINTAADSVQVEERVFAVPESDEGAVVTEEPQIIQWESGAYGMGGGGGNGDMAAVPVTTPVATGFYGIGGGGGGSSDDQPSPTEELLAKEMEESVSEEAVSTEVPNPILGISPEEERGAVQSEDAGNVLLDDAASKSAFQWDFGKIAIGSAVVSVICGVVAFILHRKKRS